MNIKGQWRENRWYKENVLKEFNSIEEWILSKNYSADESSYFVENRDKIPNLRLGGLDYQELKMHLDSNTKTMLCDVPKAASSILTRIMLNLNGHVIPFKANVHKEAMENNSFLYSYLPQDQVDWLKSKEWKKILFVRHPFERILSAFHNKV